MTGADDLIANVLGSHEYWQRTNRHRDWECACGKTFGLKVNLDYHLAEEVVAALGLTQETRSREDGWGGVTVRADGLTTVDMKPCTREGRYVTQWRVGQ